MVAPSILSPKGRYSCKSDFNEVKMFCHIYLGANTLFVAVWSSHVPGMFFCIYRMYLLVAEFVKPRYCSFMVVCGAEVDRSIDRLPKPTPA